MSLQLSLTEKWFKMTKSGYKTEDYRDITPYWCNRLLMFAGEKRSKKWWEKNFFDRGNAGELIKGFNSLITKQYYDYNIMTLGYPKKNDSDRILRIEHLGIEIRTGIQEWGAEPNKLYFVIKHGKII